MRLTRQYSQHNSVALELSEAKASMKFLGCSMCKLGRADTGRCWCLPFLMTTLEGNTQGEQAVLAGQMQEMSPLILPVQNIF